MAAWRANLERGAPLTVPSTKAIAQDVAQDIGAA